MSRQIYISAGHSDTDPGAVATHDGITYKEEQLVTNFRNKLAKRIKEKYNDVLVLTDGVGDLNKDRNIAISEAKRVKGPRIDIHMNAAEAASANGVETIAPRSQKKYAQEISQLIANITGQRLRGDKGWIDQTQSARKRLAWISDVNGILIELCFISNKQELSNFFNNEDKIVEALADYFYKLTDQIK